MKPTQEQWDKYYVDLAKHEAHMEGIKPMPGEFKDSRDYDKAIVKWHSELFMDAPNKPGYEYANND